MKPIKLWTAIATLASVFLLSCGSGNSEKKSEEKTSDSSGTKPTTTTQENKPDASAASKLTNLVVVRHKVANYAKWKMGYDAHDSARAANGLSNYIIARGIPDSNTVFVMMKAADMVKAKEFASSEDLKNTMQKAGVVGMPTVGYINVVWNDASKIDQTQRLMVTHKVKDWDEWKKAFDEDKQARIDAGLIDRGVGYTSGDSHNVMVVFAITDMAKAKAFVASKDLKDKMAKAGVDGPPSFFYYNIVQMTP
jgi:hypothetical protein